VIPEVSTKEGEKVSKSIKDEKMFDMRISKQVFYNSSSWESGGLIVDGAFSSMKEEYLIDFKIFLFYIPTL
jgi:hypothetical protein